MHDSKIAIDEILSAVIDYVEDSNFQNISLFRSLLRSWEEKRIELPPTDMPVLRFMKELERNTSPSTDRITKLIVKYNGLLHWRQTYTKSDKVEPEFLERYGFAAIISPSGPFVSNTIRAGFLMLGPQAFYPEHAHLAEEIYVVLSGTGAWTQGDEGEALRAPGSIFLHPSNVWHSLRTFDEPVLALYLWRGARDPKEKSRFR